MPDAAAVAQFLSLEAEDADDDDAVDDEEEDPTLEGA